MKFKKLAIALFFSVFAFVSVPASAGEYMFNSEIALKNELTEVKIEKAKMEGKLEAEVARREAEAAKAEAKLIKTSQATSRAEAARKGWHKRSVRAEKRAKKAELQLAKFKKTDKKARRSAT